MTIIHHSREIINFYFSIIVLDYARGIIIWLNKNKYLNKKKIIKILRTKK